MSPAPAPYLNAAEQLLRQASLLKQAGGCKGALRWRRDLCSARRAAAGRSRPARRSSARAGLGDLLGGARGGSGGGGGGDPGQWDYAPEWWGTQGGGWGRGPGTTVFAARSQCGNGQVTVTAHPASLQELPPGAGGTSLRQEWRVLRFNDTRQSVARVTVGPQGHPVMQPDCLAFEYTKTQVSAAAAVARLAGAAPARVLCVGLGGGSVPACLAHHWPAARVAVAELDPVVVAAARQACGFPPDSPRLQVLEGDAVAHMSRFAQQARQAHEWLDWVFVDAFDGSDEVPKALTQPGGQFLGDLASALHPEHGAVFINLHAGGRGQPTTLAALLARMTPAGQAGDCGYDPASPAGRALLQTAAAFKAAVLGTDGARRGCAFTLSVQSQQNAAVVLARGLDLADQGAARAGQRLQAAASATGGELGFRFDAGVRARRGLTFL